MTRPDVGIGRAAERAERIDARFKGLAPSTFGLSLDELAAARPGLFDGAFTPPVMVLREEALRHNIETMARYARASGVEHAPHGKTTLAPRIFDASTGGGRVGDQRRDGQPGRPVPRVRAQPGLSRQRAR